MPKYNIDSFKPLTMLFMATAAVLLYGCKVNYSLSGASISPDVKSVSIPFIPNNATLVTPTLSPLLTNALQDRFERQTNLVQLPENGDLNFEGEITGYTSTPTAVTADQYAVKNRLTVTVKITFTNRVQPEYNYTKTFSQFLDYDNNLMLQTVEPQLLPEIIEALVEDIFNAAVANW